MGQRFPLRFYLLPTPMVDNCRNLRTVATTNRYVAFLANHTQTGQLQPVTLHCAVWPSIRLIGLDGGHRRQVNTIEVLRRAAGGMSLALCQRVNGAGVTANKSSNFIDIFINQRAGLVRSCAWRKCNGDVNLTQRSIKSVFDRSFIMMELL